MTTDDNTPGDANKVKKAMAGKKPVKPKLALVGGTDSEKPKRKPRASKPKDDEGPRVDDAPPHDEIPDGPDDDGEFERPDGISEAMREITRFCMGLDQNDRDNGRRLIAWFGVDLCYVTGLGWLVWQGTHWQRDDADLTVRLLAQQIVDKIKLEAFEIEATDLQRRILDMAAAAMKKADDKLTATDRQVMRKAEDVRKSIASKRSKRRNWAVTSGNTGKTSAMLEQARSLKAVPIETLDADHVKFNVSNGTLRFWRELDPERPEGSERLIGTFAFEPHRREDMITKIADVAYDADAGRVFFETEFLAKVHPDAKMRTFLQVSTAYALLIGGNDEQRLFYHYGTGANGKSAFFELIGRLAGSYRQIASAETITGDSQRAGQQANPDIARLHNARLVTIEELPKHIPLREELIKALTGGTKILARFLNKDFFEFMPIFTPMLNGNSKPAISGTDYGIWRRVLLILWGVTIPEAERLTPTELASRLDAERSGVLNWLVEGLVLYLTHGLEAFIPTEVREFTQDYREERDNVGVFLEHGIEHMPGHTVRAGDIYKAYQAWCEANALRPASLRSFGDSLTEKGFKKKRGNYIVYLDVRLKDHIAAPGEAGPVPPARDPDDPGFDPSQM